MNLGSSNNEPRVINSQTNKYIDKNTNNNKNIQKKDRSKKLALVDNSDFKIDHEDSWSDKIWGYYDKLITVYKIQDPKITQALKERSPILMYQATLEFLKNNLSSFNVKLLHKAIESKLSRCLWRVGLMILYSLKDLQIKSKPKFLAYLCRFKDIVRIEDNIKQIQSVSKKFTMEVLEESLDLSKVDNKQNLFKFLNFIKDFQKVHVLFYLKHFTVSGNMISTRHEDFYKRLEHSSIQKFDLNIELLDKFDTSKVLKTTKRTIKKVDKSRKLKPVDKPSLSSLSQVIHADLWSDETWNNYEKLIKAFHIRDSKITQAFHERSPILMYNATLELLKNHLPSFNLTLVDKVINNELSTSLWHVGLMILYNFYSPRVLDKSKYLSSLFKDKDIIDHIQKDINIVYNDDMLDHSNDEIIW